MKLLAIGVSELVDDEAGKSGGVEEDQPNSKTQQEEHQPTTKLQLEEHQPTTKPQQEEDDDEGNWIFNLINL